MTSSLYDFVAIGAGPAGIAAGVEWKESGADLKNFLLLEKGSVAIDAIRKFYPEKKMTLANYKGLPTITEGHIPCFPDLTKAETITYFDELIGRYSIPIRFNSEVSRVSHEGDHLKIQVGHEFIRSKAVAIGIGILGRPNKPDYKIPGNLRTNVLYDLTSQKVEGEKVLVVGGGDTSSEYCQVLVQESNDVCLAYRGHAFSRMMDTNREAVEQLHKNKKLRVQMECVIKEIREQDGKPLVVFENENKFEAEVFDKIIYSIGGTTPINFLKTIGIDCEGNWPKYGANGETNLAGVYLVGDLVAGKTGGSIITAFNSAFRTVRHAIAHLQISTAS